ncbi:hypothetical protein ANABIO32_22610 [Rossellomorea marisflavi]|nr:hypothetical protein ANABIO32_22610 [Rossellomorea marisflavi]
MEGSSKKTKGVGVALTNGVELLHNIMDLTWKNRRHGRSQIDSRFSQINF